MTTTNRFNKRAALEADIQAMENYKSFRGCDPEYRQYVYIIEKSINTGKIKGSETFSAEGNSREYFFGNVSRWLINTIYNHQDFWYNNEEYTHMFDLLATCQKLAYTPAVKSDIINKTILDLAEYVMNE